MLRNLVARMFSPSKSISNGIGQANNHLGPKKVLDTGLNRIVWVDLEMTGLNIETDKIMEIACIITDENLNIIAEGPDLIINHSKNALDNMNDWCKKQHGKTGLTEESLKSNLSVTQAEDKILEFVSEYITEKASPLAGNSIYMDKIFLQKYMPRFNNYLHYRTIDVSTIKELCRRWNPTIYRCAPKKCLNHRALTDIRESIQELKYYKTSFFNC